MKRQILFLSLLIALACGITTAQDKSKIDWEAAYEKLLTSDPSTRTKIETGQATKEDVINWLKNHAGDAPKLLGQKVNSTAEHENSKDLSAFKRKLAELVQAGTLSKADAAKLAATMGIKDDVKVRDQVDWDAEYEKLMKNPTARVWIEKKGTSKEEVIEFLKSQATAVTNQGQRKRSRKGKSAAKSGARPGSFQFYAIVIGRLKSKDIELGEMEIDIDYVISDRPQLNADLTGKRVKLVGVSGQYLDSLLRIKRGETIKVRTGDFNPKTRVLGFGYKFHVLERTAPFKPGDFGVPPEEFRGFSGEITGKIVEANGYEVLLEVMECRPAEDNRAKDAESILDRRIRIAGFYNQHAEAFADLSQGDTIRVSVAHRNPDSDSIDVTDKLESIE